MYIIMQPNVRPLFKISDFDDYFLFYIHSSDGLKLRNTCREELITRSRITGELVFRSTPNNSNVT